MCHMEIDQEWLDSPFIFVVNCRVLWRLDLYFISSSCILIHYGSFSPFLLAACLFLCASKYDEVDKICGFMVRSHVLSYTLEDACEGMLNHEGSTT